MVTIRPARLAALPALALGLVLALAGSPTTAAAQAEPTQGMDAPRWVEPPRTLPKFKPTDPKAELNRLFEALKQAPTDQAAKFVEMRIWALWFASGSDTVDLLMARARQAMEARDAALATQLLDAVVEIAPDFAEGWNRRATLRFMASDLPGALADLSQVLAREPRHFGALVGLGTIFQALGEDKRALEAFQRALDVNPKMDKAEEAAKPLRPKVQGRDI
jgi:tetratricopeptide (TPR) repeat protein